MQLTWKTYKKLLETILGFQRASIKLPFEPSPLRGDGS